MNYNLELFEGSLITISKLLKKWEEQNSTKEIVGHKLWYNNHTNVYVLEIQYEEVDNVHHNYRPNTIDEIKHSSSK